MILRGIEGVQKRKNKRERKVRLSLCGTEGVKMRGKHKENEMILKRVREAVIYVLADFVR